MAADLPTLIRSHARWRLIFLGLALVVPLLLEALFDRQIHRLYALADHGREATAIVSTVEHSGSGVYTHYAYSVGGASYTWSVTHADAPYQPGDSFPVTYLPEDPSLIYLFGVGKRRPELRRSRNIVLGGLGYFFVLLGLWIAYTDARGI